MGKTTLVMTYGKVGGFPKGSHGNGRVVILTADPKDFKKDNQENANISLGMRTFNLIGEEVDDAYVYLGKYDHYSDDVKLKIFQAMINTASAHIKDNSHIHIVGCCCNADRKKLFAEKSGFDYISCECQGDTTLGNIVQKILSELPAEEKPQKQFSLPEEFISDSPAKETFFCSGHQFSEISALGETLFAGRSDGAIFWKKNGIWQEFGLKLNQGVNLMVLDGNSLLVGDGSCCSGATWRLKLDGTYEKILPVAGQEDSGENIRSNVYGFARIGERLLTGGGGCAGTHIYELNDEGRWQYLSNDPEKYVTSMLSASDGKVYIAMDLGGDNESFYAYDGKEFSRIGSIPGTSHAIREHKGSIYVGSTDSGMIHPTNRSTGYIYCLNNGSYERAWKGTGGIRGFFELNDKLFAFGLNYVDYSTILLELDGNEWRKLSEFSQSLTFFCHKGIVYAGGEKEKRATVFTVSI